MKKHSIALLLLLVLLTGCGRKDGGGTMADRLP